MKNYFLKSIFVLIMFTTFLGCSSDSGSDACTPITCLNGGTSTADCGCDCPQGYSGTNCSTQITPTKILITKIRVTKFPNLKPDNSYWDSLALTGWERPDIFPVLHLGTTVLYAGTPINNSFSYGADTFDFTPTTPIQITQVSSQLTLTVWDDDGSSFTPELMGGYDFYIYSSSNGFPNTFPVSNATGATAFELSLSYQW